MPKVLRERVFDDALGSIKLYPSVRSVRDGAAWIIEKQFHRSTTSVGANSEEAKAGESRADFIHKYCIALIEASGSPNEF